MDASHLSDMKFKIVFIRMLKDEKGHRNHEY